MISSAPVGTDTAIEAGAPGSESYNMTMRLSDERPIPSLRLLPRGKRLSGLVL